MSTITALKRVILAVVFSPLHKYASWVKTKGGGGKATEKKNNL